MSAVPRAVPRLKLGRRSMMARVQVIGMDVPRRLIWRFVAGEGLQ
jgi:hypothetical protein